jgi:hypothetical protein
MCAAGMIVLFDDRYQPAPKGGGEEPPQFAAEQNYGQYIYFYRNGVRCCPQVTLHAERLG